MSSFLRRKRENHGKLIVAALAEYIGELLWRVTIYAEETARFIIVEMGDPQRLV